MVTEMGAEALTGDALDAASIRAAIAGVRPDAVINELTSLPWHYTPAEMKAAAERDSRVRREGNVNLLTGMRESGVRRHVLHSSGFWYAPGPGLADESSPLAVDASPGVAAGVRTDWGFSYGRMTRTTSIFSVRLRTASRSTDSTCEADR